MSSTQQTRSVVPLVEGKHDDLKVVKLDGDRFVVTAQQAIDACSLASNAALFQNQFRDLMDTLYSWVDDRKDKISSAFITVSREGILLLIVQKGVKADLLLEDELVQLDLDIANEEALSLLHI